MHDHQPKLHFHKILRSSRAIRGQLADHGVTGGLTVFGGGGPTALACVFDFHGVSSSEFAKELVKVCEHAGCNCVSSGEDDVRCTCPD